MLKQKIPASYLTGMKGFNDLFEMLFDSLLRAHLGIELSNTAGFGWRGFRIDKYKELARCQYHFIVNTGKPHLLVLLEEYNDGSYRYPWKEHPVFDLALNGFFLLSKTRQRDLLVEFAIQSVTHALEWQGSEVRKSRLPERFIHGQVTSTNMQRMRVIYERIPPELITSTLLQNQIFSALQEAIQTEVLTRMGRQVFLEPNTNWYNWDFRGLRMKISDPDGSKPPGPTPFVWRIYYRQPAVIRFEAETGLREMALDDGIFFSLNAEQQTEWLTLFVRQALVLIGPNPIEIIFPDELP